MVCGVYVEALVRTFMFFGLSPLAPGSELLPPSVSADIMCMVYIPEPDKDDEDDGSSDDD
jgi:hypothetical protein